jgi:hypothetical protein
MVVNPGVSRVTRFTAEARKKGRSGVARERERERERGKRARERASVMRSFALISLSID